MSMTDGAAPAAASDGPLSFDQAVGILNQPPKNDDEPATPEEAGAAEAESPPDGDDAGPDEPAPGETGDDDPADEPSIDPPRSWSKEHKDAFKALPAHLQQMVADSERAREADFLRRLNDADAKTKAAEAKERSAEQARQQYENALPAIVAQFSQQFNAKFSDIKSWDDVATMRQNDPMRFMEWQEATAKWQALQSENQRVEGERQRRTVENFQRYTAEQDGLFMDKRPEFKDAAKAAVLQREVAEMLTGEYGFSEEELGKAWTAGDYQTLRDHRWQLIITDALAYRKAKAAAKTAAKKPVPPVQRPGTAPSKGEAQAVDVKILNDKLTRSGKLEDAVALLNARTRKRA